MEKKLEFEDVSPRSDVIQRLERKKDRIEKILKETKYNRSLDLLDDLTLWQNLEKEIEVQKSYRQLEKAYW